MVNLEIGKYKHTPLLFEKLGLIQRSRPNNRPYPLWSDCIIGDNLEMQFKWRTINEVFKVRGPRGLLDLHFEPMEADPIIMSLHSYLP